MSLFAQRLALVTEQCGASLWQKTAPDPPPTTPLGASLRADVAIIGAGFTGLSAALHLARAGAKVIVLEAEEIGSGGSGRNVGLVNAGLWETPQSVLQRLGPDYGRRLLALLDAAPALVFELISQHSMDCEASRSGTLHCAPDAKGEAELRRREAEWRQLGAAVTLLDAKETVRLTGSRLYRSALLDRRAGTLQPLGYARSLAAAAMRAGALVFTASPALSWERAQSAWRIPAARGAVTADWVVVTTGAYTRHLTGRLRRQQIQLPYFNFATEPLPDKALGSILPEGQGIWDTRAVLRSFRLDQAGRLIVGSVGTLSGWHGSVHRDWAQRTVLRTFAQLQPVSFPFAWYGMIDMTSDHMPRLHRLDPQVIAATGYNGRGIAPGTAFGQQLALHVLGRLREDELPLPITMPSAPALQVLRETLFSHGSAIVHQLDERW